MRSEGREKAGGRSLRQLLNESDSASAFRETNGSRVSVPGEGLNMLRGGQRPEAFLTASRARH